MVQDIKKRSNWIGNAEVYGHCDEGSGNCAVTPVIWPRDMKQRVEHVLARPIPSPEPVPATRPMSVFLLRRPYFFTALNRTAARNHGTNLLSGRDRFQVVPTGGLSAEVQGEKDRNRGKAHRYQGMMLLFTSCRMGISSALLDSDGPRVAAGVGEESQIKTRNRHGIIQWMGRDEQSRILAAGQG